MKAFILTFCMAFFITGISDAQTKNDDVANTYTSKEIGWTMPLPEGWTILSQAQVDEYDQKGLKAIEETVGAEIDYSELKHLISFKKDPFNVFQSTIEPFKEEYPGEWKANNDALKGIIYDTYVNQGIKVDSSKTTIEKIGGIDFQCYSFIIYAPNGTVIIKQVLYNCLMKGYSFGVNLNYNTEATRKELYTVWRKSVFK